MRVKYLTQEHNAVPRPGLEPGPPDPESSALTIRPTRRPKNQLAQKRLHKMIVIGNGIEVSYLPRQNTSAEPSRTKSKGNLYITPKNLDC